MALLLAQEMLSGVYDLMCNVGGEIRSRRNTRERRRQFLIIKKANDLNRWLYFS